MKSENNIINLQQKLFIWHNSNEIIISTIEQAKLVQEEYFKDRDINKYKKIICNNPLVINTEPSINSPYWDAEIK